MSQPQNTLRFIGHTVLEPVHEGNFFAWRSAVERLFKLYLTEALAGEEVFTLTLLAGEAPKLPDGSDRPPPIETLGSW